jgi:Antirestriction protein
VLAVKDEREDALAACGGLRSLTAARGVLVGERAIPPRTIGRIPMTNDTGDIHEGSAITSQVVPLHERMRTLPTHFGSRMMILEHSVYEFMCELAVSYKGGLWEFYELSNGGFYMAPVIEEPLNVVSSNGFDDVMSADAAGITACLFAFSHLSFNWPADGVFSDHFHWLREFAMDHAQANLIFAAID